MGKIEMQFAEKWDMGLKKKRKVGTENTITYKINDSS